MNAGIDGRTTARTSWAAAAALALAAGCMSRPPPVTKPAPEPSVCHIDSTIGIDKPLRDRSYPAQYWFVLLLKGYQSSGEIARPAADCSSLPVKVDHEGCPGETEPTVTPIPHIGPRELVIAKVGDTRRLVWVMVDTLSDGQAQGPVAIADITEHGPAVRTIGVLRAYPEHATLRLEKLGTGQVLVAEGERCADPRAPERCDRAIRVVPVFGDRITHKPVFDDKGVCLGSSLLSVRSSGSGTGQGGAASYRLESAVSFAPEEITVREQLALSGATGLAASGGGEFVRRVQAERKVTLRGGGLVATGPSLLARWLSQGGGG